MAVKTDKSQKDLEQMDQTSAEHSFAPEEQGTKRRHQRRSVLWPAMLKINSYEFHCQIWNLSLGGARVRVDLPLKEGTEITLSLPNRDNTDIKARIAWQEGEAIGLIFLVPDSTIKRIFKDRLHVLGLEE